jgi:hypothetical protein
MGKFPVISVVREGINGRFNLAHILKKNSNNVPEARDTGNQMPCVIRMQSDSVISPSMQA